MKDAIGQEVEVGDTIIHCGGKYASATQRKVVGITAKMVQVDTKYDWEADKVSLRPDTVINITSNLAALIPKLEIGQLWTRNANSLDDTGNYVGGDGEYEVRSGIFNLYLNGVGDNRGTWAIGSDETDITNHPHWTLKKA